MEWLPCSSSLLQAVELVTSTKRGNSSEVSRVGRDARICVLGCSRLTKHAYSAYVLKGPGEKKDIASHTRLDPPGCSVAIFLGFRDQSLGFSATAG